MSWPTPQEYNEAIQNPQANFADPELQAGIPDVNALGLPQASTGNFASVYRIKCALRDVAVRCFLHTVSDQHHRYQALSQAIRGVDNRIFVEFEYLEKGILVQGTWHPIVKMEWVDGVSLDTFVRQNKEEKSKLLATAEHFKAACSQLQLLGIAHGDLQHGNILVQNETLRLIDYDGMFVPAMKGLASKELGHPNFQHPGRSKELFDASLDNFSSWVIYLSLQAIAEDPSLVRAFRGADECILCRHIDFAQPARSPVFHALAASDSSAVRECGLKLRSLCQLAPDSIPSLGSDIKIPAPPPLDDSTRFEDETLFAEDTDDGQSDSDSQLALWARDGRRFPTIDEYITAVGTPKDSFSDPELQRAKILKRGSKFWRQLGKESVVFALSTRKNEYAIKCFLGDDPSRNERYIQLAQYFRDKLPWHLKRYFVPFEYKTEGIKVGDRWYPIVILNWISAYRLDDYIASTPHSKHLAAALVRQWREMMSDLAKAGLSHGNLEPGNIFMHEGRLRLVDYDTMYAPIMTNNRYNPLSFSNPDITHPNASKTIGPTSDNFSAWIIDTALLAWCVDPVLYQIQENRRGRLLFRSTDFSDPANSKLFALLFHNSSDELHHRAKLLYRFLFMAPDTIPPLQAHALPLLPKNQIDDFHLRKQQVGTIAAGIVLSVASILVLTTVPYGIFLSLIPTAILVYTIKSVFSPQRQEMDTKK